MFAGTVRPGCSPANPPSTVSLRINENEDHIEPSVSRECVRALACALIAVWTLFNWKQIEE